jgi:hypothetical protein
MGDGVRFPKVETNRGIIGGIEAGGPVEKAQGEDQQRTGAGTIDGAMGNGALFQPVEQRGATIDALGIGRNAVGGRREIKVFGESIPRIAPIRDPLAIEDGIASLLGGLFANRGLLGDGDKIRDYRDVASMTAAMAQPKVVEGAPLGPLTIFRPGLGNTAPGPAQIARLAQYTDKLVIAYANPGDAAEQRLRAATEVDGVPLPPELRGKVFIIGSPKNLMISFEQGSDLFLEQLEKMRRSPLLDGIDLAKSKATVVAHSQGGLDSLLTRRRLDDAGLGDTFGKLVTLATPYRGSPIANEDMAGLLTEIGERAFGLQSTGAVNALDPDYVAKRVGDGDQRLVDLSLVGQTESGKDGRGDIRTFFKISDAAIEVMRSLASLFKGRDVRENDGLVTVSSQKFGKDVLVLDKSYDHAGIAEDPSIIDQLVKRLAG